MHYQYLSNSAPSLNPNREPINKNIPNSMNHSQCLLYVMQTLYVWHVLYTLQSEKQIMKNMYCFGYLFSDEIASMKWVTKSRFWHWMANFASMPGLIIYNIKSEYVCMNFYYLAYYVIPCGERSNVLHKMSQEPRILDKLRALNFYFLLYLWYSFTEAGFLSWLLLCYILDKT